MFLPGYIGPDIGLPFMSAWGAIAAMVLAALGIILASFKLLKINTKEPRIINIAAAILKLFEIDPPVSMDGRPLL